MSRSIGDGLAHSLGVISTPDIIKHTLTVDDKYIVMGSDGIFEFLSNQYISSKVTPFYKKNDLMGACAKLVDDSTLLWKEEEDSIDDITALAIFITTEEVSG